MKSRDSYDAEMEAAKLLLCAILVCSVLAFCAGYLTRRHFDGIHGRPMPNCEVAR